MVRVLAWAAVQNLAAAFLIVPAQVRAQAPVAPVAPAPAVPTPPTVVTPVATTDLGNDLTPMPDLGVDWPDPAKIDAAPASAPQADAKGTSADRLQRYHVVLAGVESLGSAFRARFNQLSALVTNEGKPANAAQIDRRARDDLQLLRQLLDAAGRYEAMVTSEVSAAPDTNDTIVRLAITTGQPFSFGSVTLPGIETAGSGAAKLRQDFTVKAGDPVDADVVLAAVTAFRIDLGRQGYPFAKVEDPQVTVDHATNKASLVLPVTLGERAKFGRIVPVGPHPIFSAKHLAVIARFHPGRQFDQSRLDDFRRALIATGLVSAVTLTPVKTADPAVVDIQVQIDRAPPRTVAGEFGYGTGQGATAQVSWQHRNLIAPEGAVTFQGTLGTREQALGATLRMGNFHARDRVLNAQIIASHTNLDAYNAKTFTVGASIERQTNIIWQKVWSWSIGTEFVASDEKDTAQATGLPQRHTYLVAAQPDSLSYDGTDDLLNPTRGFRLALHASPELSLQDGAHAYVRTQFDASGYQPLGAGGWIVLAGRIRLASIDGVGLESIAPSRRLYAGGGGSIRGYGYQKIGPVDINGNPIGGRALTEFGSEARFRFGNFGLVPFLDAGNLYEGTRPKFRDFRFGTGLGARYYSSFGPIRVDVGTPLDRRTGESRVAVYVSLGQAF